MKNCPQFFFCGGGGTSENRQVFLRKKRAIESKLCYLNVYFSCSISTRCVLGRWHWQTTTQTQKAILPVFLLCFPCLYLCLFFPTYDYYVYILNNHSKKCNLVPFSPAFVHFVQCTMLNYSSFFTCYVFPLMAMYIIFNVMAELVNTRKLVTG